MSFLGVWGVREIYTLWTGRLGLHGRHWILDIRLDWRGRYRMIHVGLWGMGEYNRQGVEMYSIVSGFRRCVRDCRVSSVFGFGLDRKSCVWVDRARSFGEEGMMYICAVEQC
jgi:hypothetical protein